MWHPIGRAHRFKAGEEPVKLLQFLMPGTELVPRFFEDAAQQDGPDQLIEMAWREYGTRIYGPDGPPPSTRAKVSVSSMPSRSDAAAPGWLWASSSARTWSASSARS